VQVVQEKRSRKRRESKGIEKWKVWKDACNSQMDRQQLSSPENENAVEFALFSVHMLRVTSTSLFLLNGRSTYAFLRQSRYMRLEKFQKKRKSKQAPFYSPLLTPIHVFPLIRPCFA